jgi:hypothetical protein
MPIGLNEQELSNLFSFGNTEDEMMMNMFGTTEDRMMPTSEMLPYLVVFIRRKVLEAIVANNKRIEDQLAAINIKLPS